MTAIIVSSRAPVWGASYTIRTSNPACCFKSCPRVGGIRQVLGIPKYFCGFQVVPPCGGHRLNNKWIPCIVGFKSCPRVGGITD